MEVLWTRIKTQLIQDSFIPNSPHNTTKIDLIIIMSMFSQSHAKQFKIIIVSAQIQIISFIIPLIENTLYVPQSPPSHKYPESSFMICIQASIRILLLGCGLISYPEPSWFLISGWNQERLRVTVLFFSFGCSSKNLHWVANDKNPENFISPRVSPRTNPWQGARETLGSRMGLEKNCDKARKNLNWRESKSAWMPDSEKFLTNHIDCHHNDHLYPQNTLKLTFTSLFSLALSSSSLGLFVAAL